MAKEPGQSPSERRYQGQMEAERIFGDEFISTMDVAVRDVQVRLDMPPGFEVVEFSGEEISGDPSEVEPQHLALRIEDQTYASVEHFFQGSKARYSDRPHMARWFTREYDGPQRVGDDPRAAKKAGTRKSYQAHGATLDVDRWVRARERIMQTAIEARWEQDELFRKVLTSTSGMVLLHFERAGARSFWGGSLDKQTGQTRGENRLGTIMMERRDRPR